MIKSKFGQRLRSRTLTAPIKQASAGGVPVIVANVGLNQLDQVGGLTFVGQNDTDLYKQIQCNPFVRFSTLEAVIVLVRKAETK